MTVRKYTPSRPSKAKGTSERGRPPKISIKIDPDMFDRIGMMAEAANVSFAYQVRRLLAAAIRQGE